MAYSTKATTKGGRNGRAMLDNGGLALAMGLPKEMGGAGEGHNPEQLFALEPEHLLRGRGHVEDRSVRADQQHQMPSAAQ